MDTSKQLARVKYIATHQGKCPDSDLFAPPCATCIIYPALKDQNDRGCTFYAAEAVAKRILKLPMEDWVELFL